MYKIKWLYIIIIHNRKVKRTWIITNSWFKINSLQNDEIWKRKPKEMKKVVTTSYVTQMEQIAIYSLKMMQPRTTGTCHRTLSNFFFFFLFLIKLLARGKRYILAFKLHSFLSGCTSERFFLLPLLGVQLNAHRMTWTKIAMIAALIRPEMGTVTNHAMKMFLNRRQSTAFFERSQPTATTEPTYFR